MPISCFVSAEWNLRKRMGRSDEIGITMKDPLHEVSIGELQRESVPDGGWGWIVVFGCFLIWVCINPILMQYS